jgi:two-component system, cell cycle sensor histidine kinase and response regulator CckA
LQIQQIIMNLIINASESIGERSGIIYITTGLVECDREYLDEAQMQTDLKEGDYVFLEITDTGCGMDKATLSKIFDPFFSTKFTGRGLGLAAVQGIIRGHKGIIKVYSEPGKGTTFKVLLPAAKYSIIEEVSSTIQKKEEEVFKGSGTILLVDDEESIRSLCRTMLERMGFNVFSAAEGMEALDIFRKYKNQIACVLLDLTMPHMDGEETFKEMRLIRPDIPIIMSSGYNEQDVVNRFLGKGISGFIQKPYHLSTLVEVLKKVVKFEI